MSSKKGNVDQDNGFYRLDIEKVKADAKEISMWVESGITKGLEVKYRKFYESNQSKKRIH